MHKNERLEELRKIPKQSEFTTSTKNSNNIDMLLSMCRVFSTVQ